MGLKATEIEARDSRICVKGRELECELTGRCQLLGERSWLIFIEQRLVTGRVPPSVDLWTALIEPQPNRMAPARTSLGIFLHARSHSSDNVDLRLPFSAAHY